MTENAAFTTLIPAFHTQSDELRGLRALADVVSNVNLYLFREYLTEDAIPEEKSGATIAWLAKNLNYVDALIEWQDATYSDYGCGCTQPEKHSDKERRESTRFMRANMAEWMSKNAV